MKKLNLILFWVSLLVMLPIEAQVVSDTIVTTPIGTVQVKIKKGRGEGYVLFVEEQTKLLPTPMGYGPFDGKVSEFHLEWNRFFIPLFKDTYPSLCQLIDSGIVYEVRFIVKCEETGRVYKGFILNVSSLEVKYLNLFVGELTKDASFLTILQKSARQALKEVPVSFPFEKLPDWAKKEIKEGRSGYYWTFLIKVNKETLKKY